MNDAELAASKWRDTERAAAAARKAAEATAAEAKAALAAFEPRTAAQREAEAAKRQKTGQAAPPTPMEAEATTTIAPTAQSTVPWTGKGPEPPNWSTFGSYSHATYQKLETETQRWRAVLPGTNEEAQKPLMGERDGALHHWRRGLVGLLVKLKPHLVHSRKRESVCVLSSYSMCTRPKVWAPVRLWCPFVTRINFETRKAVAVDCELSPASEQRAASNRACVRAPGVRTVVVYSH